MDKKIFETASSSNTVSDIKERVIQAASGGISLTAQSNNSALSAGLLSIASTETVITSPTIPSGAGASTTLLLPKTKSPMNKKRGPADSLWEFHNIDNFPFQQPNIAGVPITSQENLLLFELIYCLTGMKGSNITPAMETYRSDGRAGSFSLKFNISDQIHSSLRDIAQEILPLASHYTCIQIFIQNATNTNCSQVLQALNAALGNLMHDYYQFFYHDFPKVHQTTTRRKVYKSCLVCDTCIRELMVIDVPPQKRFPVDNFAEWNNGHPLGLRTVHAYVLVFDMGNLETFRYCRSMRDQILDSFSHRDFSIIVVGNKYDTINETQANSQELKDISTLVRKHWRCGYVECSAQYNYKIGDVFRELMGCTSTGGAIGTEFSQSNRNKGRCVIL